MLEIIFSGLIVFVPLLETSNSTSPAELYALLVRASNHDAMLFTGCPTSNPVTYDDFQKCSTKEPLDGLDLTLLLKKNGSELPSDRWDMVFGPNVFSYLAPLKKLGTTGKPGNSIKPGSSVVARMRVTTGFLTTSDPCPTKFKFMKGGVVLHERLLAESVKNLVTLPANVVPYVRMRPGAALPKDVAVGKQVDGSWRVWIVNYPTSAEWDNIKGSDHMPHFKELRHVLASPPADLAIPFTANGCKFYTPTGQDMCPQCPPSSGPVKCPGGILEPSYIP